MVRHFGLKIGHSPRFLCSYTPASPIGFTNLCPEDHYSIGNPFTIKPRECFTAILCNNHSEDETCAILTPEGCIVTCHIMNTSYNQSLLITSEMSISNLIKYKYISVTF